MVRRAAATRSRNTVEFYNASFKPPAGSAQPEQAISSGPSSRDYLHEITRLHQQIRAMQLRQEFLQHQLDLQSRIPVHPPETMPHYRDDGLGRYSLIVNLAFRVLSWLFLFVMGFAIALIVSASLNAGAVVNTLLELIKLCLPPLAVLALCIIATTAILESLK